jgi:hypothetical protein
MLQRVPAVFTGGPLYATVAIFVAAVQVLCAKTLGPHDAAGRIVRRSTTADDSSPPE